MEIQLEERLGIVLVPPHLLPVMEQLHVLDVDAGLFRNARTDVADRLLVADPRLDDLWWMLPALPQRHEDLVAGSVGCRKRR